MITVPWWYIWVNALFFSVFAGALGIWSVADEKPVGAFVSSAVTAWALYSWLLM